VSDLVQQRYSDLLGEHGSVTARVVPDVHQEQDDLGRQSLGDRDGGRVWHTGEESEGPVGMNSS
jgi:hypothetical protein